MILYLAIIQFHTPALAESASSAFVLRVVKAGESLWKIAKNIFKQLAYNYFRINCFAAVIILLYLLIIHCYNSIYGEKFYLKTC